jgi:acyl-coenzyme A thioesterase PaaI-like protein
MGAPSQGEMILGWWRRLGPFPGGKWIFSKIVGWKAPYTGSVKPRVEALEPGYCRVTIRERRALRNPFRSIHAVALLNVAEAASGLATLAALRADTRGIITKLEIEFAKKARGRIAAECRTAPPATVAEPTPHIAEVILTDQSGDPVATAKATWTLAPKR